MLEVRQRSSEYKSNDYPTENTTSLQNRIFRSVFTIWNHLHECLFSLDINWDMDFQEEMWKYAREVGAYMRLLSISPGFVGCASTSILTNDTIALLPNSPLPIILRPHGDQLSFRRFAYVHGITNGTLKELWKGVDVNVKVFVI